MTQPPLENQRDTSQEMSNLLDVSLRTASATPRAFYDELAADFTKHTADVVVRAGEGLAFGLAGTLLLKVPKVAPVVGLAGLVYTGWKAVTATSDFVSRAAGADTDSERASVANSSAHDIGANLAALTESTPGMIAGGFLASSRSFGGPPPLYTRVGDIARENYTFRGPGSVKLSPALIGEQGEFDALSVSKTLAQRHPWQGVETGSTVDLNRMRISRSVSGEAEAVVSVPNARGGNIVPFHIHGPDASAGFLPSNVDVSHTPGLGILQQGDVTTFYAGQAREYAAFAKAGNGEYFTPSMRAVSINQKTGLAQRFTGEWTLDKGLQLNKPVELDLGSLLKIAGRLRASDPWQALSSIAAKTGG